jgi:Fur family ferric uptake transcriptional regulator
MKNNQTDELRQVGLKSTLPRIKILKMLESTNKRHFSAEDVYQIMLKKKEKIGLATIYRVLTQFETAGLVLRHHFGDRSVFELADTEHHDHMLCMECGKIIEFLDHSIEKAQIAIAKEHNFEIQDHSLYLYGQCENCRK